MITERTKSILLLTSHLSRNLNQRNKPLSVNEWNRLARWLHDVNISPENLLTAEIKDLLSDFKDKTIDYNRLSGLMERRTALALALEKWTAAGIWIVNRGDDGYPKRLKDNLKDSSPPILFGVGDISLFNKKYIGVVGSRDISVHEIEYTKELGKRICEQNYGLVSGGAKGVDITAMMSVLQNGGNSIGFLAEKLLSSSTSSLFRKYIMSGNLLLATPFNPEAGFNVGNAMSRNKLIYIQSSVTIIVKSNIKGGTWEGANENLKKKWAPLWIKKPDDNIETSGNKKLVSLGGKWLPQEFNLNDLTNKSVGKFDSSVDLFNKPGLSAESNLTYKPIITNIDENTESKSKQQTIHDNTEITSMSFFDFFLQKFINSFSSRSVSKEEINSEFNLNQKQLEVWLKEGIESGKIIKKSKNPVKYSIETQLTFEILGNNDNMA